MASNSTNPEVLTIAAGKIWVLLPPFVITFGVVGNVLSAVIMFRHRVLRLTPTAVFLGWIAVYDTIYLFVYLADWLVYSVSVNLRNLTDCKLYLFAYFYVSETSSLLLAAMTVDRCVAVACPIFSKRFRCRKKAIIACAVVSLALFALNMHFFWTTKHTNDVTAIDPCVPTSGNEFWFYSVWPVIDSTIYCFIPFVVLLCGNSVIIVKTLRSSSNTQRSIKKSMNLLLILISLSFFTFTAPNVIKNIIVGNMDHEVLQMDAPLLETPQPHPGP